jgi:hypothetical protein
LETSFARIKDKLGHKCCCGAAEAPSFTIQDWGEFESPLPRPHVASSAGEGTEVRLQETHEAVTVLVVLIASVPFAGAGYAQTTNTTTATTSTTSTLSKHEQHKWAPRAGSGAAVDIMLLHNNM